jgi:hypothetical protein
MSPHEGQGTAWDTSSRSPTPVAVKQPSGTPDASSIRQRAPGGPARSSCAGATGLPPAGQVWLQWATRTAPVVSLTIKAGRGPRLSGVEMEGTSRTPISAQTIAELNRSTRTRPDRVT